MTFLALDLAEKLKQQLENSAESQKNQTTQARHDKTPFKISSSNKQA